MIEQKPIKPIITADDEAFYRDSNSRTIQRFVNVPVEVVDDGIPLVEKVRQSEYSIVFTDADMPRMWGSLAIAEIRKFNPTVPIYVVSNGCTESQAREMGATGAIFKLLFGQEVKAVLERHIPRKYFR